MPSSLATMKMSAIAAQGQIVMVGASLGTNAGMVCLEKIYVLSLKYSHFSMLVIILANSKFTIKLSTIRLS